MLKSIAFLIPSIRRLYEQRNALLERVAELENALVKQAEHSASDEVRLSPHTEQITQGIQHLEATRLQMHERFNAVEERFNGLEHEIRDLSRISEGLNGILSKNFPIWASKTDLQLRDIIEALLAVHPLPMLGWTLVAERKIAFDTNDHLFPRGTKNDNSRHPRFVATCKSLLGKGPIRHLDLGCAGGGLVWDFTRRGHHSVGIEGSDYSLRDQRAEWRTIPDRLFTADICYPFHFEDQAGNTIAFDIISAWELFEHIPEAQLSGLLANIIAGLRPGGYLVASIATFMDKDPVTGSIYHHTIQPRSWWEDQFKKVGLMPVVEGFVVSDFVRGRGNPAAHDWDVRRNPELGFHVVLRYEPLS